MDQLENQNRELPPVDILTKREFQIATLVAGGRVNKEIAARLGISEWTVSTHLRRMFAKLGVDSRAAMVYRCFGGRSERWSHKKLKFRRKRRGRKSFP